jgi:DNA primase
MAVYFHYKEVKVKKMLKIEEIKGLHMVEFLERHYGLDFSREGEGYVCFSPFNEEKYPSFKVRCGEDGHWLFNDFSSNRGGSLIDFVLEKEGFAQVADALRFINRLAGGGMPGGVVMERSQSDKSPARPAASVGKYNIAELYPKLLNNDTGVCVEYLGERGIESSLIGNLLEKGVLVHNRYEGESYCCFAVFDNRGELSCLDNHQIGGKGKFVLGKKHAFSLDWSRFDSSEEVYVCEGIIDYLSLKSLEGEDICGLALLGRDIKLAAHFLSRGRRIISALDADEAGAEAFLDLDAEFYDKEISIYNFGGVKDANEYLQGRLKRAAGGKLSADDKLRLYKEFMSFGNKSQLARRWGINRSYMYAVIKECDEMILEGYLNRRAGRRASGAVANLSEAHERIAELEEENRRLGKKKEFYYAESEFLKVRLKWAEQEAAESRGESVSGEISKNRKKHLKKKRKRS